MSEEPKSKLDKIVITWVYLLIMTLMTVVASVLLAKFVLLVWSS